LDTDYFGRLIRMRQQIQRNELPRFEDIEFLLDRCGQADKRMLEVIDLLASSHDTRSANIERARKLLKELV
jgi:hypothetical protein